MKVSYFFLAASLAFLGWLGCSFLEVINHNLTDCVYSAWNFFTLLIK